MRIVPVKRMLAAAALLAVVALGALAVACGETAEEDPTPVATFKITPAAGTPTAPAETPATSPTAGGDETPAADETPGANEPITVVAENLKWDKKELEAKAGEVTIIMVNNDSGIPHNIQFFKGSNARGESVGKTEIKNGPAEDTLVMDLGAGEYYYRCDVHPDMKGTLIVR